MVSYFALLLVPCCICQMRHSQALRHGGGAGGGGSQPSRVTKSGTGTDRSESPSVICMQLTYYVYSYCRFLSTTLKHWFSVRFFVVFCGCGFVSCASATDRIPVVPMNSGITCVYVCNCVMKNHIIVFYPKLCACLRLENADGQGDLRPKSVLQP